MFDVIWYKARHKDKVLPLLNIPSAQERVARGIFGVRWGPGQPPPPGSQGQIGEYCMIWGNFLGYEIDPDKMRAQCDLTEIAPGLVGGKLKEGYIPDSERAAQQLHDEQARLASRRAQEGGGRAEYLQAEQDATDRLLIAVARRQGIRKPEKLARAALLDLYTLATVTDEFEVPTIDEWKAQTLPPFEESEEVTLENVEDWEKHLTEAYAKVKAPSLTIRKPYRIERVA